MSFSDPVHVVLGAGPTGRGVAGRLVERGDRVRVVTRSGRARLPDTVEHLAADLTDAAEAARACEGAAAIYGCVGFEGYRDWEERWPPLFGGMLAGAASVEAPFVFVDNLYMYGPVEGPLHEDLPLTDHGVKPAVRARLTRTWQRAHEAGRIRAVAVRSSDFYGPGVTKALLGDFVIGRAVDGKAAQVLGDPDRLHSFAYMPDVTRATVDVADAARRGEDVCGRAWHVPCAPARPVREIVDRVFRELGREPRMQAAGSLVLWLMGLVDRDARELRELMFQWTRDYVVDDAAFRERFGWDATPLDVGIPTTVAWFRDGRGDPKRRPGPTSGET